MTNTNQEDTINKLNLLRDIINYLVDNNAIHTGFICFQFNHGIDNANNVVSGRVGSKDCNCFQDLLLEFMKRYTEVQVIDLRGEQQSIEEIMKDMKES